MATKRYQRDFKELELRRREGMRMLARGVAASRRPYPPASMTKE
jgi:hypothetical protein